MKKMGYIANGSVPAQRKFLSEHPEKHQEIFSQCPSYVYLIATSSPPVGVDSIPLTNGRSIATDRNLYPFKGLLAFVESVRPEETGNYDLDEDDRARIPFRGFSRFFLDQDTGGAIRGKARADIYFGEDEYAFFAAMNLQDSGKLYYLILKLK
ncbi:MAG: hypothetical protein HC902_09820 [Calothrix sp. SM1_5_4]|nr:hypothetical protein [Calothrix sp. SM1_5_4]